MKLPKRIKIVADENMPHLQALFADFADLTLKPGREICHADLVDVDVLLCRSITTVDQTLLQDTLVKFVGTATIGIDHLDIEWLNQNNIHWVNAAGCNAAAVAQYVISGIAYWLKQSGKQISKSLSDITVGIIGAGNVGTKLAGYLDILNVKYILCDPLLKQQGDTRQLVEFKQIIQCDVITLHVPISYHGEHKTHHMLDSEWLESLNDNQLLINAARGSVINNNALLAYLKSEGCASVILDVYENEPYLLDELLNYCLLATPHIAGHTLEGKSRGSYMIYQKFCDYFKIEKKFELADLLPTKNIFSPCNETILDDLLALYDIQYDNEKLANIPAQDMAQDFEKLRKNYLKRQTKPLRRDYEFWQLLETQQGQNSKLSKLFGTVW